MKKFNKRRFDADFEALREKCRALNRLPDDAATTRIEMARADFGLFCQTYFPHHLRSKPSKFHLDIFARVNSWGKGYKTCIAAPRGNAKTTILSRLYPLWRVVRGDVKFITLAGDSLDGAAQNLEVIKIELEDNQRVLADFPEICGEGESWRETRIITKNRIQIKAYGSGTKIRGANFRGHRPDLIILDDLENDENVQSKGQRDKMHRWFENSVLNLGPADDSAQFVMIGTMLHNDCLLSRVGKRPDFECMRYKAIGAFPLDMKPWETWERLYHLNPADALEFYRRNNPLMDAGASVLWPSEAAVVIPDGMMVEILDSSGTTGRPHPEFLEFSNREISKIILGQTLTADTTGKGSYSLGQVHNDVRLDIMASDCAQLAGCVNDQIIRPLVDLNFGQQEAYPSFVFEMPNLVDKTAEAQWLKTLIESGFEEIPLWWIRERFDLPKAAKGEPTLADLRKARSGQPQMNSLALNRQDYASPDLLDVMAARATAKATPFLNDGLAFVERIFQDSASLDEAIHRTLDALPGLSVSQLTEVLSKASFAAHLAGCVSIIKENA